MKWCAIFALATVLAGSQGTADPVDLSTFRELLRPEPNLQISYGPTSSQTVDVFLPSGPGPHAVAVLVHGGC